MKKEYMESYTGSQKDLIKMRAKKTPELLLEAEKFLRDYGGGGICMVMNTYDEDGDYDGTATLIMGVDDSEGMQLLSKGLIRSTEEVQEKVHSIMASKKEADSPLDDLVKAIDALLEKRK